MFLPDRISLDEVREHQVATTTSISLLHHFVHIDRKDNTIRLLTVRGKGIVGQEFWG